MDRLSSILPAIVATAPAQSDLAPIGRSRQGRQLHALRVGDGPIRVSLIAGCHADEPVGPLFLRRLASYLARLDPAHELRRELEWWVVPHANPDGEAVNREWHDPDAREIPNEYDLARYRRSVVREGPGDDVEFGFPTGAEDVDARPESRAIVDWWNTGEKPWSLHGSLHGMAIAAGPWFLIEEAWAARTAALRDAMVADVVRLGYQPLDIDRQGEKGFRRIGLGFSTRPRSDAMRDYFEQRGDRETAALFRPNSMETIRATGSDALTIVSECPLFLEPPQTSPPIPQVDRLAQARPMPVSHQLELMGRFVGRSVALVRELAVL